MLKKIKFGLLGLLLGCQIANAIPQQPPNGGTGAANPASTSMSWDASVSFVGAFGVTFNFTALTNVTFPTSGTLLSTGGGSLTQGSVLFADGSGQVSQNNSKFFWNNSSLRLGIGDANGQPPASTLQVSDNSGLGGVNTGLTIEQFGSGDAVLHYLLNSGQRWITGIDNSDGDAYKISNGTDLGTNNAFKINTDLTAVFSSTLTANSLILTNPLSASYINYNTTNFQNNAGTLNTIQNIDPAATPAWAALALTSSSPNIVFTNAAAIGGQTISLFNFNGVNSAASNKTYAYQKANIQTNTAGSEAGTIVFGVMDTGSLQEYVAFDGAAHQTNFAKTINVTGNAVVSGSIQNSALTASTLIAADSSKNFVSIANATNSVLVTDGSSNKSWSATLPDQVQTNITKLGSPITTVYKNTAQPMFFVYRSSDTAGVTGAGSTYTVVFDSADYDVASEVNLSTGTITWSQTGKYHCDINIKMGSVTSAMTVAYSPLIQGSRNYQFYNNSAAGMKDANNNLRIPGSLDLKVTAGDTSHIEITLANGVSNSAVVKGSALTGGEESYLSCHFLG